MPLNYDPETLRGTEYWTILEETANRHAKEFVELVDALASVGRQKGFPPLDDGGFRAVFAEMVAMAARAIYVQVRNRALLEKAATACAENAVAACVFAAKAEYERRTRN